MFNLEQFDKLREGNMLEVKDGTNGIPTTLWETYSSFANTYGGTILLGVKEDKLKRLIPTGLSESKANNLIKIFGDTINSNKVNVNLLSNEDVTIHKIESSYIVIINIPQANKIYKPIFINNNLLGGTYRRNHEGDYKCSREEINAMLRDQDSNSNDSYIVRYLSLDVLNKDTIGKYRNNYRNSPTREINHPFNDDENDVFLFHIGAANYDDNGILHPTRAGLLMFGNFYDIVREYPNYFLDYQDHRNLVGDMRWSHRITSVSGEWSGNLYDFFYRIAFKITEDISVPFKMRGIFRDDTVPMKKALREALCNTLANADYHGELGIIIKQYQDKIVFLNPGTLAIPKDKALVGGTSMARNKNILNMFSYVNIGERAGSGIPLIINATKEANYLAPILFDELHPDCTKLTIYIKNLPDNNVILPDNNVILPDSNVILPDNNVILPDSNIILPDNNVILPDSNVILPDSNVILPDSNVILPDSNVILPDSNVILPDSNANLTLKEILNIIKKSKYSKKIKIKLLKIVNVMHNVSFRRQDISNLLNCSDKTSYNYIQYLLELNLLNNAYGKGKYEFKK